MRLPKKSVTLSASMVSAMAFLALLVPLAPALHVPPRNGSLELQRFEGQQVPELARFRKLWTGMYNLETHLQEPMPESVQLVMGVMSVASPAARGYREVLRDTWMQQRGACYWSSEPRPGCSVHVAFVFGSNGSSHEPGALVLPMTKEGSNAGKSLAWFAEALRRFPWATHIGKMDVDAYPFFHKLVARMAANRSCVGSDYEWIGRPDVAGLKTGEKPFKGACKDKACMGWYYKPGLDVAHHYEPFKFMQGQMYVLSNKLASALDWKPRHGAEDVVVGRLVQTFATETGHCVAVRRLDASAHLHKEHDWSRQESEHFIDSTYANDFEAGYQDRRP